VTEARRIAIVDGHPDPDPARFVHALAQSYADAAVSAGHELRWIRVAKLDFPLIRTREDWEKKEPPAAVREAQDTILWAQHLVILYPLWLGDMPALLKALFEQVARPGFALDRWKAGCPSRS
jgi:putative NADPH-quinone reductase